MKSDQLLKTNIHKAIIELSIPGMVSSILETLYQLIDAFWVGKLGAQALAAIGGSAFILWAVFSLTALSVNGISAFVAQYIGSGKSEQGRKIAGQGMLLNTVSAIVIAVIVFTLQDSLFSIMGFESTVLFQAKRYMTIIILGLIFAYWFTGLEAIFRGMGDTRTPMYILAGALTMNAVLDPLFIFGWGIIPGMGIAGAAIATVVSEIFAVIIIIWRLKKINYFPRFFDSEKIKIDWNHIKRILSVGAPIALSGFLFSMIYVVLTNIISRFGVEAVAAIGVCHRIEGIAWFACVGFSVAASTLVGQFIGAVNYQKAKKAALLVNGYGVITLIFISLVFYFFPEYLLRLFTSDLKVQAIGVQYLKIIALFEIFLALEVIMEGAFSGAGYTFPVMVIGVVLTALRIPLAWILAISWNWGPQGIWWAIGLTTFFKGALISIMFLADVWKRKIHLAPTRNRE